MIRAVAVLCAAMLPALIAAPARAQAGGPLPAGEAVRFCPNRPDLGASGCTTRPGQVQVELSALDWTVDDGADEREDRIGHGDVLMRFGIAAHAEVQFAWTPYARVRTRDKASGEVAMRSGIGDVRVALRRNLANPDGSGLSLAVEPFAVLPVGTNGVGDDEWSAGVQVPVSYDLGSQLSLGFTGEMSAQADQDGRGRHLDANGVVGVGYEISDRFGATAELFVDRDDDPAGATTQWQTAGSVAWHPTSGSQLDLLAVAGLNRAAPDFRLVLGGAFLF